MRKSKKKKGNQTQSSFSIEHKSILKSILKSFTKSERINLPQVFVDCFSKSSAETLL